MNFWEWADRNSDVVAIIGTLILFAAIMIAMIICNPNLK